MADLVLAAGEEHAALEVLDEDTEVFLVLRRPPETVEEGFVGASDVAEALCGACAPIKEVPRLVLAGRIVHCGHGDNPFLRWIADNVTVDQDSAGNLKPSKGNGREKVDCIVVGIMALDRALRRAAAGSVYDERGVRTV